MPVTKAIKQKMVKELVAFWASSMDVMLQDFQRIMLDDDIPTEGKSVQVAKCAQLCLLMHQYFLEGIKGIAPGPSVVLKCQEACVQVKNMVTKHITEIEQIGSPVESEPATERNPKLLN